VTPVIGRVIEAYVTNRAFKAAAQALGSPATGANEDRVGKAVTALIRACQAR
jgi:hypothetical protein